MSGKLIDINVLPEIIKLNREGLTLRSLSKKIGSSPYGLSLFCKRHGVVLIGHRQRLQGEASVKHYKERNAARNAKNPNKRKARNAIHRAISEGRMFKADCYGCRYCWRLADTWHHHLGYEREHWFDVIPVCFKHHGNLHKKKRMVQSALQ